MRFVFGTCACGKDSGDKGYPFTLPGNIRGTGKRRIISMPIIS